MVDLPRFCTYASSSTALSFMLGKISLLKQGEDIALYQLPQGIKYFSVVLNTNIDEFQQIFGDFSDTENESYRDITDHDSELDDDDVGNTESLCVLPEEESGLDSMTGQLVSDNVICWKFPVSVSRSMLAGADGSNACSIIAVLFGYMFVTNELNIPDDNSRTLSYLWINTVCQCISTGNMVYNTFCENLVHRYLSIEEAVELLSSLINVNVTKILPVRFTDTHQPSTIVVQQAHLVSNEKSVAQFTHHERRSVFLSMDGKIVYFDSRLHFPHGAVIVCSLKLKLDNFCSYIWNLEAQDKYEFGNLVQTSYPDA